MQSDGIVGVPQQESSSKSPEESSSQFSQQLQYHQNYACQPYTPYLLPPDYLISQQQQQHQHHQYQQFQQYPPYPYTPQQFLHYASDPYMPCLPLQQFQHHQNQPYFLSQQFQHQYQQQQLPSDPTVESNEPFCHKKKKRMQEMLHTLINEVRIKVSGLNLNLEEKDMQFIDTYKIKSNFMQRIIRCSWKKPEPGVILINSDGSKRGSRGGYGAILRDCDGTVIAAVTGDYEYSAPTNIHTLELKGVEMGLLLAKQKNIKSVKVATDCWTVIMYIKQGKKTDPACNTVVSSIKALSAQLDSFDIFPVVRETNRAADYLAGMYPGTEFLEVDPSSFSQYLKDIINDDSSGKVYERTAKMCLRRALEVMTTMNNELS